MLLAKISVSDPRWPKTSDKKKHDKVKVRDRIVILWAKFESLTLGAVNQNRKNPREDFP